MTTHTATAFSLTKTHAHTRVCTEALPPLSPRAVPPKGARPSFPTYLYLYRILQIQPPALSPLGVHNRGGCLCPLLPSHLTCLSMHIAAAGTGTGAAPLPPQIHFLAGSTSCPRHNLYAGESTGPWAVLLVAPGAGAGVRGGGVGRGLWGGRGEGAKKGPAVFKTMASLYCCLKLGLACSLTPSIQPTPPHVCLGVFFVQPS